MRLALIMFSLMVVPVAMADHHVDTLSVSRISPDWHLSQIMDGWAIYYSPIYGEIADDIEHSGGKPVASPYMAIRLSTMNPRARLRFGDPLIAHLSGDCLRRLDTVTMVDDRGFPLRIARFENFRSRDDILADDPCGKPTKRR